MSTQTHLVVPSQQDFAWTKVSVMGTSMDDNSRGFKIMQ